MNKLIKIILTISLSSAIILSLSSCFFNGSQTESGKTNNSNTNDSSGDNNGSGDNESSDKTVNLERFVSSMEKKNFTYRTEGKSTVRVDGNLIEVGDNTFNDIYESTTDEFNQPVQYFYDYSNGKYVKDFYEASSNNIFKEVENFILDLTNLCWESVNGTKYKIDNSTLEILSANSARLTVNGKITSITKIGENNLKTPNASMVDDRTTSGSANPSNPSQSSPLIYDAGTKKWDLNLFKDTLLKWNDETGRFAKSMAIKDGTIEDIIYINFNNSDIDFGLIYSGDYKGKRVCDYNRFSASDNLMKFINNNVDISEKSLVDFLNGLTKGGWWKVGTSASVPVEYNKYTATSDQKKTFEAMTKNILNKFSPDGKKAEVLYWMKQPVTAKDDISSLYKFCDTWEERFIVSVDGDVQMWNIGVSASTYYGTGVAYENVANDPNGELWQIHGVLVGPDKTDLDDKNIELYSNTKSYSITK